MRLATFLFITFSFTFNDHIVCAEDSTTPLSSEAKILAQPENKEEHKVEIHATPAIVQPIETTSEKKDAAKKVKLHHGKVTIIHNSVSFSVKDDAGKEHILRLAEINTPYLDKPHGPVSLKAIKDLIENKDVTYEILSTDSMGKKFVKASTGDTNINAFMIQNGHAWVSKKFGHDPELIDLQDKAKAGRVGLWANARTGFGSKNMKRHVHKNHN